MCGNEKLVITRLPQTTSHDIFLFSHILLLFLLSEKLVKQGGKIWKTRKILVYFTWNRVISNVLFSLLLLSFIVYIKYVLLQSFLFISNEQFLGWLSTTVREIFSWKSFISFKYSWLMFHSNAMGFLLILLHIIIILVKPNIANKLWEPPKGNHRKSSF